MKPNIRKLILPFIVLGSATLGATFARQSLQSSQAAGGPTAWPPASWSIGAWFIDVSNSTGCASDTACNGQSATCAGSGACPFLTYPHLNNQVWQCFGSPKECPRLRQNTTITDLSLDTTNSNPRYFSPAIENNAIVELIAPLGIAQQVATGVLSNVTAQVVGTNLLLAQSGATAPNQLVVNATHPSRAFTYAVSSGSIYKMTQPSVALTPTSRFFTEVNTWANGDSVTVYNPVAINWVSITPTPADINSSVNSAFVYLINENVYDPSGTGLDPFEYNGSFFAIESIISRGTGGQAKAAIAPTFANTMLLGRYNNGATAENINGGAVTGANGTTLQGGQLDNNVIVNASLSMSGGLYISGISGFICSAYIESTQAISTGGGTIDFAGVTGGCNDVVVWGPGALNCAAQSRCVYPAGAGAAAAAFKQAGGFQLNGQTSCVKAIPGAAISTVGITLSAASLDSNCGATTPCALTNSGGATLTNGGF